MSYLLRIVVCTCAAVPFLEAAQVQQLLLTHALPPSCSASAIPVPAATFSPTDNTVYLWAYVTGLNTGDVASDQYVGPNGQVYQAASGSWDPVSDNESTCFTDSAFNIAGAPPASMPGTWTVRFLVNGQVLSTTTFTISGGSAGGGGSTGSEQVQQIVLAHALPSSCSFGNPPAAATTFLTTDPVAYLWVAINNANVGDIFSDQWYEPNGQLYSAGSGSWPAIQSGGSICLTDSAFHISGAAPASLPGSWTVKVSLNGQVLGYGSFTIQAAQPTCTYALSATSQSFQPSGGTGVVSVVAAPGCGWAASSNEAWISIEAGANGNGNGTVTYLVGADSGGARTGTLMIAGQTYTVSQNGSGSGGGGSTTTMVLPQFVYGAGWYTALYFTNMNQTPVSFQVSFVGEDGNAITVPSMGTAKTTINLAARGSAILEAPNQGGLIQGYASVSLPPGVTGYGVFRLSLAGAVDQEAVVPLSPITQTTNTLIFDDTNYITGVAIVNPGLVSTTVSMTARDSFGQAFGTSTVTLPARGKTAFVLRNQPGLSGVTGQRGSVDFSVANGNVAVLGLRFNGTAFTSIPAAGQ